VASHDLYLVRQLAKRVLVLDHGKLIDDFRPAALKKNNEVHTNTNTEIVDNRVQDETSDWHD
jgi:energy-coupling factor transporter ATP-binding protein EcfA2